MKHFKQKSLPFYGAILLASLTGCGGDNSKNDASSDDKNDDVTQSKFELQLLHFADVDGGRDIINNVKNFAAILEKFRAEKDHTLVLSSGDNWIPGPEYSVAGDKDKMDAVLGTSAAGRAHIAYLNALGVQASAFGNHEFDLGTEAVANLIAADDAYSGAAFPYLSANLNFSTDENLSGLVTADALEYTEQVGKIAASTIITVGGEKIGVVGATTPMLKSISSPGNVEVLGAENLETLAAEIQADVDVLTQKGINKIILLAHMQQISIEKNLAPLLNDVDIIVAGGSNTILADEDDRLMDGDAAVDTYPLQFTNPNNEPVLVVNTDGDYTYLGRLIVKFDHNGVIDTASLDKTQNGIYASDTQGMLVNGVSLEQPSTELQKIINISDALTSVLQERAGTVFGKTDVYLNGERTSVRTEETNLGTLTAEANLYYAQQIDPTVAVSIKNGGGIRGPIGSCSFPAGSTNAAELVCSGPAGIPGINQTGDISQLDLETSLRFNNSLTLLTLTGEQLKAIAEHAVAEWAVDATPGAFGQIAGMRYSFDPSNEAGSRIQNLVVLDGNGAQENGELVKVVENGVLVASDARFRVVTLGYLAGGGDGYPFPLEDNEAEYAAANVVELKEAGVKEGSATFADNGTEQDALAEYLLAKHPVDGTNNYSTADVEASKDRNIQNLAIVEFDTIISNVL